MARSPEIKFINEHIHFQPWYCRQRLSLQLLWAEKLSRAEWRHYYCPARRARSRWGHQICQTHLPNRHCEAWSHGALLWSIPLGLHYSPKPSCDNDNWFSGWCRYFSRAGEAWGSGTDFQERIWKVCPHLQEWDQAILIKHHHYMVYIPWNLQLISSFEIFYQ